MDDNFIKVYENAISDSICDQMIECFTTHSDVAYDGKMQSGYNPKIKKSTDLNLLNVKQRNITEQVIPSLYKSIEDNLIKYVKQYPLWRHGGIENESDEVLKEHLFIKYSIWRHDILMKKYHKGTDGFHAWHEDQGFDGPGVKRILVCMFYLNDVEEGGETEFYFQKIKTKPTKGSLVIFPAYFTHLHKGHIPISNDKYICNFWILKGNNN
jgi:hypothetical protein